MTNTMGASSMIMATTETVAIRAPVTHEPRLREKSLPS